MIEEAKDLQEMERDLPDGLLKRLRRGESRQVRHASASDLVSFRPSGQNVMIM